jgi:hypothetical protein
MPSNPCWHKWYKFACGIGYSHSIHHPIKHETAEVMFLATFNRLYSNETNS